MRLGLTYGRISRHSRPKKWFQLPDRDWAKPVKDHFQPWSCNGLHWVPLWERDNYEVTEGEVALPRPRYGFWAKNHPPRLCVEGLDFMCSVDTKLKRILSMLAVVRASLYTSASLLGFSRISAFDIDADSIRICQ